MNTRTYEGHTENDTSIGVHLAREQGRAAPRGTPCPYHHLDLLRAGWFAGYMDAHGIAEWRKIAGLTRCAIDRRRI